jgi:hypothetical protein
MGELDLKDTDSDEDHYADDGYDGVENTDDWHFNMEYGEWCYGSHEELAREKEIAKELSPFYTAAKISLIVSVSGTIGSLLVMIFY